MAVSQPLPGFRSPGASFDEPFEMLAACHDRVRRSLALLERLEAYLGAHPVDEQAKDAARDVLRYFAVAAPAHHEDEERHVVPLLQASEDAGLVHAASRLLLDHQRIRLAWQALMPRLEEIVEGRKPDARAFARASKRFIQLHESHLSLEDSVAFPNARRLKALDGPQASAEMGREMSRRRMERP